MDCCGGERDKLETLQATQKWDYINLSDFKSTSCFSPFSYGILYITLIISIAVYLVDIFTAVNLLLFDKWSGQIQPAVPLNISRWIFAGCIILSLILLVYRWIRAIKFIRHGGIAQSYLDPLAVRVQSIRMGARGRGWRRFLVFTELTKGKKGSEYVALFTYFSFEAWLRILFAEGPRQGINAITLYSVMQADLLPNEAHAGDKGTSPVAQFFINVKLLADGNKMRAAVLFGMLFTLVIWVIAFISLAVACILYIMFLWHHIPSQDGGLRGFCKKRIDSSLQKIVDEKVEKAIKKEDMKRSREELKMMKSNGSVPTFKRQPTLPVLDTHGDDKLPNMPMLSRQTTQTALPPYSNHSPISPNDSMPALQRQPTLPDMSNDPSRPGMPSRSGTLSSNASYSSNAPLLNSAGTMGYGPGGRPYSPAPSQMGSDGRSMMTRTLTSSTQGSQRSYNSDGRPPYPPQGRMPPRGPMRQNTGMSNYSDRSFTPGPPPRSNTGMSNYGQGLGPGGRPPPGAPIRQNTGMSDFGRNSPAPNRQMPGQPFEQRSQTPQGPPRANGQFVAYNPARNASPAPSSTPAPSSVARNFSAPYRPRESSSFSRPIPPQRSGTVPIPPSAGYDDSIYDSYGGGESIEMSRPSVPSRAATSSPGHNRW